MIGAKIRSSCRPAAVQRIIQGEEKKKMHSKNKTRVLLTDLLCDLIGSILYSLGIYTFAKMANFAPGGLSGLALIMNYLWGLPIGITTMVLNIPFLIISFKIVGKQFLLKTFRSMIFCTVFLDLIFPHTQAYSGSPFMAALFSGVCLGAGLAFFYMRGSSSGGTDFLTMSIKVLRPHLSIGMVTMSIDLVIILMGWPAFGNVDAVLYGLLATAITSIVIDKIMYGMGSGKMAIIITDHGQEIADRIGEITGRGSTAIQAVGTYTKQNKDVLLCACSSNQAYAVRSAAHEVDPEAFVMLTETSEVFGEGFIDAKR